ncbi:rhodanese-like domain-containing protein [Fulvivirga lutea]|uniref:Rhodanese-like domain-containing protein n=1 Tax=Fulvivirga lutea TaxID=2810512 RepID=A0A974WL38_9BACT|nr:rhodanese-like domain-containing protein [Fulvivirga lutea]QSE99212.1 rhodanese-like domain-containing protein [Fulvivirga lutea]
MSVISATELKNRLTNGENLIIIDVREAWEYDELNIGAENIPLADLPHSLHKLDYCRNKEVIVHCKSGSRSNQAMKYLTQQGFKNVKSLQGGIEGYLG